MSRPTQCIAPGCRKPNTGPRFKFLCAQCREASAKQIKEWQDAWHEKLKAEKKRAKKAAKKAKK